MVPVGGRAAGEGTDDGEARLVSGQACGGLCGWAYCTKWGASLVVSPEEPVEAAVWVCLIHLAHARARDWLWLNQPTDR